MKSKMKIEKAVKVLEDYIDLDRSVREDDEMKSDFDEFCEEKCIAMEVLIDYYKKSEEDKEMVH